MTPLVNGVGLWGGRLGVAGGGEENYGRSWVLGLGCIWEKSMQVISVTCLIHSFDLIPNTAMFGD